MTRTRRTRKAKSSSKKGSKDPEYFDPDHLALSHEEIRKLALQITSEGDAEKFIRRMVMLIDDFKSGRTGRVAKVARQSKDPSFVRLMSAISSAAKEGRMRAAINTAFYAANYGFQNSFEYVCVLMTYLDGLSQGGKRAG